jgi:uncharacterized membrane protein
VLISIVGVLIVGGIILLIVLILRKKRKSEKKRKNEQQLHENNSMTHLTSESTNANQTELSTAQILLKRSQISFSELTIEKKIGIGGYGKVCLGKWNSAPVALKFCKNKGNIEDFMREIKIMVYVSI